MAPGCAAHIALAQGSALITLSQEAPIKRLRTRDDTRQLITSAEGTGGPWFGVCSTGRFCLYIPLPSEDPEPRPRPSANAISKFGRFLEDPQQTLEQFLTSLSTGQAQGSSISTRSCGCTVVAFDGLNTGCYQSRENGTTAFLSMTMSPGCYSFGDTLGSPEFQDFAALLMCEGDGHGSQTIADASMGLFRTLRSGSKEKGAFVVASLNVTAGQICVYDVSSVGSTRTQILPVSYTVYGTSNEMVETESTPSPASLLQGYSLLDDFDALADPASHSIPPTPPTLDACSGTAAHEILNRDPEVATANLTRHVEKVPKLLRRRAAPKMRKKDPNRPRGYISAFNFFVQEKRPDLLKAHPELQTKSIVNNNHLNKLLGGMWKQLPSEEKTKYDQLATSDKLRYLHEMKTYQPTEGYECEAPRINLPAEAMKGTTGKKRKGTVTDGSSGLIRPKPAYTHFASQERRGVLASGSIKGKAQMSQVFGQRWQLMCEDEISMYYALEYADKARYEAQAMACEQKKRVKGPSEALGAANATAADAAKTLAPLLGDGTGGVTAAPACGSES